MPVAWAVDTASRVARVTGEGIIHVADTDTARRRWGPQRLVPRPTAPTASYNNCYDAYGNYICSGQYRY